MTFPIIRVGTARMIYYAHPYHTHRVSFELVLVVAPNPGSHFYLYQNLENRWSYRIPYSNKAQIALILNEILNSTQHTSKKKIDCRA